LEDGFHRQAANDGATPKQRVYWRAFQPVSFFYCGVQFAFGLLNVGVCLQVLFGIGKLVRIHVGGTLPKPEEYLGMDEHLTGKLLGMPPSLLSRGAPGPRSLVSKSSLDELRHRSDTLVDAPFIALDPILEVFPFLSIRD
jgi:hypothetical protein